MVTHDLFWCVLAQLQVGIRTDAIKANPEFPKAVFDMYSKAKQIAYANLETTSVLKTTLPWVTQEFEDTRKLMGKNYWPYGIEANRKELGLVMRYTHEVVVHSPSLKPVLRALRVSRKSNSRTRQCRSRMTLATLAYDLCDVRPG